MEEGARKAVFYGLYWQSDVKHLFSPDNGEHLLVSSAEFFYSIIMHEKQDSSEKRPKHDHGKASKNYKDLLIG